jgi:hypothetical protein
LQVLEEIEKIHFILNTLKEKYTKSIFFSHERNNHSKMNSNMKENVVRIFNDSQVSFFSAEEGISKLKALTKPNEHEEEFLIAMDFVNEFNNCLQILLSLNDSTNVHFVKQFVIEFLASLTGSDNEKNIQHDVIDFLLKVFLKNFFKIVVINFWLINIETI